MQTTPTHQRFIIERPRLIELLDSFESRIVLITAPAGYGKSTLARQWAAKRENVLWYEATPASRDVAALAMGLASACKVSTTALEPLAGYLRSLSSRDDARDLADMLADSIDSVTDASSTLIIDDADLTASSDAASTFMETLVSHTSVRMILVGRRRPAWVTARKLLYGTIGAVGRDDLLFTAGEAAEVLPELTPETVRSVWTQARGWAAVIGLAALTRNRRVPEGAVGVSLYDYLAEELLSAASAALGACLPYVSLFRSFDVPVLDLVFGDRSAELLDEARQIGFLYQTAEAIELHPLLRRFIDEQLGENREADKCDALANSLISIARWDDAFHVIRETAVLSAMPALIESGLDGLLDQGRLSTLDEWLTFAQAHAVPGPHVALLESELARRAGQLKRAETQAARAAAGYHAVGHLWTSRAHSTAGMCAHLGLRPAAAKEHHRRARATARTEEDARRAAWGEFTAHHAEGHPSAATYLAEFDALLDAEPRNRLRSAAGHLLLASAEGAIDESLRTYSGDIALRRISSDPLVTSSFLYQLCFAYGLAGRYSRSLEIAVEAETHIRAQRLFFASTHVTAARVLATIGLRRFKRADQLLVSLFELAEAAGDDYEVVNARALRARLLLSCGKWDAAADELKDWQIAPEAAIRAEVAGIRAVALALSERTTEANELADESLRLSSDAQGQTFARTAQAIIDLKAGADSRQSRVVDLADTLIARQNYDGVVHAYRSYPPLLQAVIAVPSVPRDRMDELIRDARDVRLGTSLGLVRRKPSSDSQLSPREAEVLDLMRHGHTNKEIARLLFISDATVKVHVQHVLEKLDARSRTEAVVKAYDT